MALDKYKVCPSCGEHNPPVLLECRKCESDLTGVRVVDAAMEEAQKQTPLEPTTSVDALVRICECGAVNPPQARKCKSCGEDISDIRPSKVERVEFSYSLCSVDGELKEKLSAPVLIVGREGELRDYLKSRSYVSRQHAKFTIVAGKVFVENLSATNKTFVNNKPISNEEPTALKNGDEIGLGGKVIDGKRQELAAYLIFKVNE